MPDQASVSVTPNDTRSSRVALSGRTMEWVFCGEVLSVCRQYGQAVISPGMFGDHGMSALPDAMVIIDTTREANAVLEARRLGIPTVAIVDTNADPEMIDYPIAGNDDAIRAIRVMLQKLVDAIVSATGEARVREQVEMAGVSA